MAPRVLMRMLTVGAFLTLSTGLAHALHVHEADSSHRSDQCAFCVLIVAAKAIASGDSPTVADGMDWGQPDRWTPSDNRPATCRHDPITPRGPPFR